MKRSHRTILVAFALAVALGVGYWLFDLGREAYYISHLGDSDSNRQREAITYLAVHKVSRAVPALIQVMANENEFGTAMLAANALGQVGTKEAVDALIAEVKAESPVAPTATWGLFLAADARGIPALLEALESGDGELQKGAAVALSRFDRMECIPGLIAALEDYNAGIDSVPLRSALADDDAAPTVKSFVHNAITVSSGMADYCSSALRKMTGQSFGYDASAGTEERRKAVGAWRAWGLQSIGPEQNRSTE
jgi:hypothetical protein